MRQNNHLFQSKIMFIVCVFFTPSINNLSSPRPQPVLNKFGRITLWGCFLHFVQIYLQHILRDIQYLILYHIHVIRIILNTLHIICSIQSLI